MRRNATICVLLAAVTFILYWPVHEFQFVDFDDPEFIENNQQVRSGLNWDTIRYAFTTPVVGNWHPVTTLSHALDCQLFGLDAGAHHVVNVAIHALNAALLFLALMHVTSTSNSRSQVPRVTGRSDPLQGSIEPVWKCFFVSALFAVHPLRVESVAWLAERKDVLSGLFFMLTVLTYSAYSRRRFQNRGRGWCYYVTTLLFFTLGLMSKPMLVTVPFLLLLLDVWPLERVRDLSKRTLTNLFLEKVPFLVLSTVFSMSAVLTQRSGMASAASLSIQARLANATVSYGEYLKKFFWPRDLAVFYPHRLLSGAEHIDTLVVVISTIGMAVMSVYAVRKMRSRPFIFVGWFWYIGMLVPVIGLVQVGEQSMADRYTYLPMIGVSIVGIWFLCGNPYGETKAALGIGIVVAKAAGEGSKHHSRFANVVCLLFLFILGSCMVITRNQLDHWRGTIPLFEHALQVTGENINAEFALGVGYDKSGRLAEAEACFQSVLAKRPSYLDARFNLGLIHVKQRRWIEAVSNLRAVVERVPTHFAARSNLAAAYAALGSFLEADAEYAAALDLKPDSPELLNNYAWFLATAPASSAAAGQRAVVFAERACELSSWRRTTMVGTLSAAYARAGRFADAIKNSETAVRMARLSGEADLIKRNQELLRLWRSNTPCTESNE